MKRACDVVQMQSVGFQHQPALLGPRHQRVLCVCVWRWTWIFHSELRLLGRTAQNGFLLFLVISHCSKNNTPKWTELKFCSAFVQLVQKLHAVCMVCYTSTNNFWNSMPCGFQETIRLDLITLELVSKRLMGPEVQNKFQEVFSLDL